MIDVAIHHSLGVGCFDISAMVFNHVIGMENIGTYLAAPFDLSLFGFLVGLFRSPYNADTALSEVSSSRNLCFYAGIVRSGIGLRY